MLYLTINFQIDYKLQDVLKKTSFNEPVEIFIVLKDQFILPENSSLSPAEKVSLLKNYHFNSQKMLVEHLKVSPDVYEVKQFWVVNAIYVKLRRSAFENLILNRNEIYKIYYNNNYFHIIDDVKNEYKINSSDATWNIIKIRADSVWIKYGYTGNGIIVGSIDTGVDTSHPALLGKVLSQYWFDAINGYSYPYDDHNHGTHTIGTILGGDGLGSFSPDIGVAPGAKVIACKAFDSSGSSTATSVVDCIQHFTELKANQNVPVRAVNNSWGTNGPNDWLWYAIWNGWRANGIIPVFSIGNCPPFNKIASPGDYPIVIGVGAVDQNDSIWYRSCRGPASDSGLYADQSYWSRPDWNYIKPDIAAPGVGVPSSVANPPNGYSNGTGTSMATPHITGIIALMLEKKSDLNYYQIYRIITDYGRIRPAGCLSNDWPNNNCGWGRIDALLAIEGVDAPSSTEKDSLILQFDQKTRKLKLHLSTNDRFKIDIYSMNGTVLLSKLYNLKSGFNEIPIELKRGVYVILLKSERLHRSFKISVVCY